MEVGLVLVCRWVNCLPCMTVIPVFLLVCVNYKLLLFYHCECVYHKLQVEKMQLLSGQKEEFSSSGMVLRMVLTKGGNESISFLVAGPHLFMAGMSLGSVVFRQACAIIYV